MMDFKKHTLKDGQVRYSYHIAKAIPFLEGVGYTEGEIRVLDESYEQIDTIKLHSNKDILSGFPAENHDFILIDDKHYIISAYVGKTVWNIPSEISQGGDGPQVVASILQEVKDNKVIWQWDSTDYPQFYQASLESNNFINDIQQWADYVHFNSMVIDPEDNNLICSFKNLNSIIKINRLTGEIMWVLGGALDEFGLTKEQMPSRQHYARLTKEGNITIFDNGNEYERSRVLEYSIDEINKRLIDFNEYIKEGHFSPWAGSAQKIDDNIFLVGWGGGITEGPNATEYDFEKGKVLFEIKFENNTSTYRCVKIK